MLHPFISSRKFRLGDPGLLVASVVTHAGLIALAVTWPQRPIPAAVSFAREFAEQVTYAFTDPLVDRVAESSTGRRARSRAHHRKASEPARDPYAGLAALQLSFSANIPAPDVPDDYDFGAVARHVTYADADGELARTVLGRGVPRPNVDGAYTEDLVEKAVLPYHNNPRPRYPQSLLAYRVQDEFEVFFVVDSTGRVDEHTIRVTGNRVERLLVDAVRYALKRSRYFPAEVGGRRVPQLVEQRFIFRVEDR